MKHNLIAIFVLSITGALLYANTLNSPFVFDDKHNITENPAIRISSLDICSLHNAGFKSPSSRRPVANISFALNYLFGKYNVTGYHIANILIHILNSIFVYLLSRILMRCATKTPSPGGSNTLMNGTVKPEERFIPLLSALIFVAHPIQTQSVTYIVQRMNSMAVFFYLLAVLLYLYGRLNPIQWKRVALWTGGFFAWILALGTKEIAATLPVVLFVVEWYFFQELSWQWLRKNVKYFIVPILLLMLIALIYTDGMLFSRISAGYADRDFSMFERMLTQPRVILFYLGLILFPHPSRFNLLHTIQPSQSLFDPVTTLLSLGVILVLIGCAISTGRRYRIVSFAIAWFFIHMLMESSIIGLEMIFEHRLYLPMVGLSLLIAYGLTHLLARNRLWMIGVCLSILLFLGASTIGRNTTWSDGTTLWTDVVAKNPNNDRAHNNLGLALEKKGLLKAAIDQYFEALRLNPDNAETYANLGIAIMRTGNYPEAIRVYLLGLEITPGDPGIHSNLGVTLERNGQIDDAITHYEIALEIDPEYAEAHNNLGIVLMKQKRYKDAIRHFSEAVRIDPADEERRRNLALAHQHGTEDGGRRSGVGDRKSEVRGQNGEP